MRGLNGDETSHLRRDLLTDDHLCVAFQGRKRRGAVTVDHEERGTGLAEPKLQLIVRDPCGARYGHAAGLEHAEEDRRPDRSRAEEHEHAVARHEAASSQERSPLAGSCCDIVERAPVDHTLVVDEPKRHAPPVDGVRLDHVAREVERLGHLLARDTDRSAPDYAPAAGRPSHCSR